MNPLGSRISRLEDSFSFGVRNSFYRISEMGSGFHYPNFSSDYRKSTENLEYTRATGATYRGRDGKLKGFAISSSTVTYGTGSKTWTVAAGSNVDMEFVAGENITATGQTNQFVMTGTVTSYNPTTQQLVCTISSLTGTAGLSDSVWKLLKTSNPRIQCDSSGTPLGLLIEPQRTNLCDGDALVSVISVSVNSTASLETNTPLGSNATGYVRNVEVQATNAIHALRIFTNSYSAGTKDISFSIFAKKGTGRYLGLSLHGSATIGAACIFDLEDGTVGQQYTTAGGTINSTKVESWGNGWYRIVMNARLVFSSTTSPLGRVFTAPAKTGNTFSSANSCVSYLGALETFKTALFQVEDGAYETTMIVGSIWTTGVTRSPDTARYEGTKFTDWYLSNGTGKGTFVVDFQPLASATAIGFIAGTDLGDGVEVSTNLTANLGYIYVSDAPGDSSATATMNAGMNSAGFVTIDTNDAASNMFALNGTVIDSGYSLVGAPSEATVFSLGSIYQTTGGIYIDHYPVIIRSMKWFDRVLSSYELRYYTGMRG